MLCRCIQEFDLLQPPCEHGKDGHEGNIHADQTPEILDAGHFETRRLERLMIDLARWRITDVEKIDNAIDRYRLPAAAVIGWQQITKHATIERETH